MRWLTPGVSRRDREIGAVTTIFAVLLSSGVVMGMLALSVDVGSIMYERRQLQNGADATASGLAQICAKTPTACSGTDPATAPRLATLLNDNSQDGTSQFDTTRLGMPNGVCGRLTANLLMPLCASAATNAPITDLAECPPLPDWLTGVTGSLIPYVETYSKTRTTSGSTILPKFFSQALTGGSGKDVSVTACSRAAWGPAGPPSVTVLPLMMSECDWASQVGWPASTNYPPGPSGPWPGYADSGNSPRWPTTENAVYSKGNPTSCDTSSAGGTAPGGFAWVSSGTGSCSALAVDNSWIKGEPGADGCDTTLFDPYRGTVVYIPVFDCMQDSDPGRAPIATDNCNSANGSNAYYHVAGFAAFYLSGWHLTKGDKASVRPPGSLCSTDSNKRCISGWFIRDLVSSGEIVPTTPTDPNYGITVIKPAG